LANKLGMDDCIRAAADAGLSFALDNLEEPTGNGLAIEAPVSLEEDETEIIRRLEQLRDELELTLAPGWSAEAAWL